jgi:radical SAM superfamily enzyme YgiQ (UPF0313 family)
MNLLIVYPKQTNRFWIINSALKLAGIADGLPPVILLKIASLLPKEWNKKLIDMNNRDLKDEDICQADYVFITAMLNQRKSTNKVIEQCKKLRAETVAYGSLFTNSDEYNRNIDHLVFDESEITMPQFLNNLRNGKPKRKYTSVA